MAKSEQEKYPFLKWLHSPSMSDDVVDWLSGPVAIDDMYGKPVPNDASSLLSLLNSIIPSPRKSEEENISGTVSMMLPGGGLQAAKDLSTGAAERVIRAIGYHGTPHKFPPTKKNPLGEFDMSKIGTGEGAQAFGHGVYVAEEPGVARSYMEKAGNLYKVDVPDEHINKMLDWDKPLSEQSEAIRNALAPFESAVKKDWASRNIKLGNVVAGDIMDASIKVLGLRPEKALQEAGIPGIRYLDQGSRTSGQGTSNYVLFDPSIAKIIGRD